MLAQSPDLTLREAAELAGVTKTTVEKAVEAKVMQTLTCPAAPAWRLDALCAATGGGLFRRLEVGKSRGFARASQKVAMDAACPPQIPRNSGQ